MKMKNALENDRAIPTELRKEKDAVANDLQLADRNTMVARSHIDDEYEQAKYQNPKLLITTCRDPSQRLTTFQKELKLILPNSTRVNRGSYVVKDLVKISQAPLLGHITTDAGGRRRKHNQNENQQED